jgi:hypothetical protein
MAVRCCSAVASARAVSTTRACSLSIVALSRMYSSPIALPVLFASASRARRANLAAWCAR